MCTTVHILHIYIYICIWSRFKIHGLKSNAVKKTQLWPFLFGKSKTCARDHVQSYSRTLIHTCNIWHTIYTGCVSKNLTLYKNVHWTKLILEKWASLLILQWHLSLDKNKVKIEKLKRFKMNYFLVLNLFLKCFFTGKILSVGFLRTHPVYMIICIQYAAHSQHERDRPLCTFNWALLHLSCQVRMQLELLI